MIDLTGRTVLPGGFTKVPMMAVPVPQA